LTGPFNTASRIQTFLVFDEDEATLAVEVIVRLRHPSREVRIDKEGSARPSKADAEAPGRRTMATKRRRF
jgi:hypothetical protein